MRLEKKRQVFLLHFAGGNVYSFYFMKPYLPNDFEFIPIELPGRGKRMVETLIADEEEAINDLVKQIQMARNENPFLIFGHSMGASLGLRVAKKLEELGDLPLRLIVAGNAGPGISERKSRSTMSDDELKEELITLGGVPVEVLDNEELYNFFTPIIRSDFKVLESGNELSSDFRLKTPITAIMGSNEEHAEHIDNWKNFTFNDFKSYLLEGNHFFIHDHPAELVKIIAGQDD